MTRTENDFQGSQGQPPRPETEESQPLCRKRYRGVREGRRGIPEEDEGSALQDGPHPGFGSKSLPALKSADRQAPPATEAEPRQEDFNPALW